MFEEKPWKNGDHSVTLDGLVKKRLNDKGRLEQRPDGARELALKIMWRDRQEDGNKALPVELGLSRQY